MKFQDSSFNGLKVTAGTKSVTHARTHARSKSNMPHQLFQSWGHKKQRYCFFRCSRAVNSVVSLEILTKFDFMQAYMYILITCKFHEDCFSHY